MADIYTKSASALTDSLVSSSPGLLDPVSEEFIASSDRDYGQWRQETDVEPDLEDVDVDSEFEEEELPDGGHDEYAGSALAPSDPDDLARLDALMNRNDSSSGLMSAGDRSDFVHTDDDAIATQDSGPWYKFGWFDWKKKPHRLGAAAVIAIAVILVFQLLPGGGSKSHKATTKPTDTPAYTVPTITQSAAAAPPPSGGPNAPAIGPIGILDARTTGCIGGSNNPRGAINKKDPTDGVAWMCVPAQGIGVPGTILRVKFDDLYYVTALEIIPGWMRSNPDQSDEWIKHMTVSVVEYQFNDPDETRITQPTDNFHGPVPSPIDPPVKASGMTITINELAAPIPVVPGATTLPGGAGTLNTGQPKSGDLKDFAISGINIIGRRT